MSRHSFGCGVAAARARPRAPVAQRDLRLDTLRGFMLVAMAVNHLDTELRVLTDHAFGFVTTAEGFVFLSGLVAGLVYTRRTATAPAAQTRRQAWHRARQIYGCHLLSFLLAVAGVFLLNLLTPTAPGALAADFAARPRTTLLLGAALLYQPSLLDILPMYCVFMLALPLLLSQLRAGRTGWLAGGSAALWLLAQTGWPTQVERGLHALLPVNFGSFDLFAWQLIFGAGVFFGYRWSASDRPVFSFRPAMLGLCLCLATPLWALKNNYLPQAALPFNLWAWTDKPTLAPLRLLNFTVIAYLIAAVAVRRPRLVVARPLAFLGRHSLAVFTFQSVVALLLNTQPQFYRTFNQRTFIALALSASLFLPAWAEECWRSRRQTARPWAPAGRHLAL
jgi:hypothetical protein